jgi:hypothetical protein
VQFAAIKRKQYGLGKTKAAVRSHYWWEYPFASVISSVCTIVSSTNGVGQLQKQIEISRKKILPRARERGNF